MSWLNLNHKLNSIKGQISNFASNVLAEDEGQELSDDHYKDLKNVCKQQELEIKKLRELTEGLQKNQKNPEDGSNGSWDWNGSEENAELVPTLKKKISVLETEKAELLVQLEQLDADNQENLLNIMRMKEKLQFELNNLNEKYLHVKQENKILIAKEEKLNNEIRILKDHNGSTSKENNDEYSEIYKHLTETNQNLNHEMKELKNELLVIKDSNSTLQRIIEDTKKAEGDELDVRIQKMESENKILNLELKNANEKIEFFEKKSLEDEDNCQKLAFILETYETQVSSLKKEAKEFTCKYEGAQNQQKEIENLYNDLKIEYDNLNKKYECELDSLQEEINQLKSRSNQDTKSAIEMNDKSEEIERWKKQVEELTKLNEELVVKSRGRMDLDLEDELEDIQQEHEAQLNVLREELEQLKSQEKKNITDSNKFEEIEEQKLEITRELHDLQQQFEYLQENHKISLHELHNKYINIITDNIKKFQECKKPSDFEHCVHEDDPHIADLSKHIENIIKILLDLRCKCEDLEKQVLEISEEKNAILIEKNHEIEKLIQNSDMLSQEIVTKNHTIKEYENECNEIGKNNELLINELETLKSNPALQTISESNEDNMIYLESQLENANKRIQDLEKIIDDLEKQRLKQDVLNDKKLDLENVIKEFNKTETEIDNKKRDYDELLNSFDQLQIHYESIKKELEETKEELSNLNKENSNLKTTLEKLNTEYEMFEYQISELNINCEGLKEEMDDLKVQFKALLSENSILKLEKEKNMLKSVEYESQINLLSEKLSAEEQDKNKFESQMETLTEKLKSCKMAETSLKLQYEQKSKELAIQSEARYNLEISLNKINADLAEFQNNFMELQTQNDKLQLENETLAKDSLKKDEKVKEFENLVKELQEQLNSSSKTTEFKENTTESEMEAVKQEVLGNSTEKLGNEDYNNLKQILDETVLEKANLHAELSKLSQVQSHLKEVTDKGAVLHQQLQEVTNSRNELINMVTMKHQENVTYHNEIQKLNQVLTTEIEKYRDLEKEFNELKSSVSKDDIKEKNKEIEKLTDQNNFLKEKCEVIAKNLLEEQSKVQQLMSERSILSDKEIALQKKLDRLQTHLIELEEHYTAELYQAEQKNLCLKTKMSEIEEREKSSSTMYTSVSIRANQHVESLQNQLQNAIQERDSLRKQISDAEDQNTKQAAALANLQFVLEQFRRDKEKDVMKETDRIRRHIHAEKQVQEDLKMEISNLKLQLEERNQGLLAASRLSDQLESSKKTIFGLREEVSQLQTKLSKTEENLKNVLSSTDGKVDKLLIKNLILGYVTSNNNMNRDQIQILKIIATVLDFNQQDHDKVKLNKPQQGWLSSFLAPQPDIQNQISEESLSKAFIKFLENESKPRVVPSLLSNSTLSESSSSTKTNNSRSTTPSQTPIVLNEIVLPTFTDFAQNRNSSSILKDVLKENN